MRNERKSQQANLRKSYTVILEAGTIIALLFMITAVKVTLETEPPKNELIIEPEFVDVEEVIQTVENKTPPPPPRVPVPVAVPDDEIIEDPLIDLDSEIDLNEPMPLPDEPIDDDKEEIVFRVVEQMPELKGSMAKLQENVKYPEMARRLGIEGRVTVQFIVNEQGKVENAEVVRGIGGGADEEALKAVQKAEFIPGKQRGRAVRVQYTLSINFRLQN